MSARVLPRHISAGVCRVFCYGCLCLLTDRVLDLEKLSQESIVGRTFATLLRSAKAWSDDRAIRLGAAIAYYSLFALIPILLLAVSLAGIIYGQEVAGSSLENGLRDAVGEEIAALLVGAIDFMRDDNRDSVLPLISLGMMLFTATALFVAWNDVVGIIWDRPKEDGVAASLRRRLFGLTAVMGCGLLLVLVIFAETLVTTLDRLFQSDLLDFLLKITGSAIPALLGAMFLMVLFKFTPNTEVRWKSVWLAAAVTMGMLSVGAWGYGLYLGKVGVAGATEVAGALFLGLALVYYSAQILLYGVEIVKEVHDSSESATRAAVATGSQTGENGGA